MDIPENINLPLPPRALQPPEGSWSKPVDVVVTMADNSTKTGKLVRYIDTESELSLENSETSEVSILKLSMIKSFKLMNSRNMVIDDNYISTYGEMVSQPEERQDYQLTFHDETIEEGETLGSVTDSKGIHLFIAQPFNNYYHYFVPSTALATHRIGSIIGEVLLKNNLVEAEDLQIGLDTQKDLRTKKLGEYLTSQAIVTAEDLQSAIEKHKNSPNLRLGEVLVQENVITEGQLDDALKEQKNNRSKPLGEILIQMGAVSVDDMKRMLASKLGIPYVNLKRFQVDLDVAKMVPEKIARRHKLMPLCIHDSKLIVAVENPLDRVPLEDLKFHTKTFVEPVMASAEDLDWAINKYFNDHIDELALELSVDIELDEQAENIGDSDNALVKLVNKMIVDAHSQNASDIHIEPYPGKNSTIIRFRKDGTLVPYVELPYNYRQAMVSRLKIMCGLDIAERRKPQDGKIDFKKYAPINIELRVATIPTAGGMEDVVMRLLANGEPIPLKQMGLRDYSFEQIQQLITKPYGLFLVCGPTGSGKTTTLHSILGFINTPDRKIWTAEDPVEITQKGLRQLQVNNKVDLTFANAMRAFLRADPDVIMVGEMRDEETTSTGIEASLTGHLVFSTLHTNSAPESIVRLLDMGMDPFNFSDALLGILAQRLAKRLCPICKECHEASEKEIDDLVEEYGLEIFATLEEDEKQVMKRKIIDDWVNRLSLGGSLMIYTAVGCIECGDTGYDGRLGLHELLVASDAIKKLIHERATVKELTLKAFTEGMVTLKQDGIEKSLQGHTDIHQVRSVCVK